MHVQLSSWTWCPDFGLKHCLVILFESAKSDGWVMSARASTVVLGALLVALRKRVPLGASREKFLGFPIRSYTNQPAELQRLARLLKLCMKQVYT